MPCALICLHQRATAGHLYRTSKVVRAAGIKSSSVNEEELQDTNLPLNPECIGSGARHAHLAACGTGSSSGCLQQLLPVLAPNTQLSGGMRLAAGARQPVPQRALAAASPARRFKDGHSLLPCQLAYAPQPQKALPQGPLPQAHSLGPGAGSAAEPQNRLPTRLMRMTLRHVAMPVN
ncbi:hypothetical protein COO60DRAFT_1461121 [Scenedesmus sp. NREL 46B-D3]|nr:hypothetical protein COO60DRAFT_1461121 [Scenedesmus sp. NREL 46B-D3]